MAIKSINYPAIESMESSLNNVSFFLETTETFFQHIVCHFNRLLFSDAVSGSDFGDFVFSETSFVPAVRTSVGKCLQIHPSDAYLVFVRALVASNPDFYSVSISHGWPRIQRKMS